MAALNFPSSPANGDVYQGYVYNAAKDVWTLVPQMLPNTLDNVADVDIDTQILALAKTQAKNLEVIKSLEQVAEWSEATLES